MIPKQNTTPELVALSARLTAMGPGMLYQPILSPSQLRLHGRLIELFNSIEFNLRRSAEFLGGSSLLGKYQKKAVRLRPTELIPAIKTAVDAMDPRVEDIADSHLVLDEISEER